MNNYNGDLFTSNGNDDFFASSGKEYLNSGDDKYFLQAYNRNITNARYKIFYLFLGMALTIALLIILKAPQPVPVLAGLFYGLIVPNILDEYFNYPIMGAAFKRKI